MRVFFTSGPSVPRYLKVYRLESISQYRELDSFQESKYLQCRLPRAMLRQPLTNFITSLSIPSPQKGRSSIAICHLL